MKKFPSRQNNKISSNSVGKAAHELILESVQFYEAYNLLKVGYFEAIDQFKKWRQGKSVSLIYLVVNLSEEGMTSIRLNSKMHKFIKEISDYLELWENEAPLYGSSNLQFY